MLSDTSLAQATSQELLWKIKCTRCKKPIVVDSLAKRVCKYCLIKKTELHSWVAHKKHIKNYIQSCILCNYIFLSRNPKRKYCSLNCSGKAYRERKRRKNHAV